MFPIPIQLLPLKLSESVQTNTIYHSLFYIKLTRYILFTLQTDYSLYTNQSQPVTIRTVVRNAIFVRPIPPSHWIRARSLSESRRSNNAQELRMHDMRIGQTDRRTDEKHEKIAPAQ